MAALSVLSALSGATRARLQEFINEIYRADVDATTLDWCRQRVETLLAGRPMPMPPEATPAQRAAIAFAEQFVLDVRGFTDHDEADLHAHFTDAQLTTLTFAVATFDAVARAHAVVGL